MNGENDITFLTCQTFDLAEERAKRSGVKASSNDLERELLSKNIQFWHCSFKNGDLSVALKMGQTDLEFPVNWSIFKDAVNNPETFIELSADNNCDKLFDVMNELYSTKRFFLVSHQGEITLVADDFNDNQIVNLIEDFLMPEIPMAI